MSGHKFLGTPMTCGVVLTRAGLKSALERPVDYIGGVDSTVSGSRNGHAAVAMWFGLLSVGLAEHARRADAARALAAETKQRLRALGWEAWRNPSTFTVVLRPPSETLIRRFALATDGTWSHIVCVPGVRREHVDAFLDDLALECAPHDAMSLAPA